MSLRSKILLPLLCVLALTIGGLGLATSRLAGQALEASIVSSVRKEALLIFRSMDIMLKNARSNLETLVQQPAVINFALDSREHKAAMNKALREYVKQFELFHAVGFVSKDGYLVASSAVDTIDGTTYLGAQSHYVASLAGRIGISDVFKSSTANPDGTFPPIAVVALPVIHDGQVQGALFASLDMLKFARLFIPANYGGGSDRELQMILLNSTNTVVLHPDTQRLFRNTGPDVDAIATASDGASFTYQRDGTTMFAQRITHPNGQWVLAATGKKADIFMPITILQRIIFFASVAIVAAVSLLTYTMINGLLKRITGVMRFAQKVAAGNLQEPLDSHNTDELGTLSDSLREMVKRLVLMIHKAEEASRSKSDFLARMSHEIRTPMNGILGMCHLCMQTPLTSQQSNYLTKVTAAAKNLLVVINDILDFSKIEAGKFVIEQENFSLAETIGFLDDMVGLSARNKNIDFTVTVDQDVPDALYGAGPRLLQVLINLCGNAVKFTEKGFVSLHISTAGADGDTRLLEFAIQDTGIGIAPSKLSAVFAPFEQAEGSSARKFGGTGLGLSISKSLIELMGGDITVHSNPGAGSTFRFSIPLHPATGSLYNEASCDEIDCRELLHGARILLVEDNEINQEIASEMLSQLGLIVSLANNGREGVEMAENTRYDIILMDIAMPEMDGIEATQKIRAGKGPNAEATPILALTAHALVGDRDKCLEAAMNDYITKPIDYEELRHKITLWLSTGL